MSEMFLMFGNEDWTSWHCASPFGVRGGSNIPQAVGLSLIMLCAACKESLLAKIEVTKDQKTCLSMSNDVK